MDPGDNASQVTMSRTPAFLVVARAVLFVGAVVIMVPAVVVGFAVGGEIGSRLFASLFGSTGSIGFIAGSVVFGAVGLILPAVAAVLLSQLLGQKLGARGKSA